MAAQQLPVHTMQKHSTSPYLLEVVRDEVLHSAMLACADDDAVLVSGLVDHVLAHPLAPIARELHEQLPLSRALLFLL